MYRKCASLVFVLASTLTVAILLQDALAEAANITKATPPLSAQETIDLPSQVTNAGYFSFPPRISLDSSPNGRWIVCWAPYKGKDDDSSQLWIWSAASKKWRYVCIGTGSGSWRPDSSCYAFGKGPLFGDAPSEIAVLHVPHFRLRVIHEPFVFMDEPSWSPNGRTIAAFAGPRWTGGPRWGFDIGYAGEPGAPKYKNLVLLTADGDLRRTIVLRCEHGRQHAASWSPDGRALAYCERSVEGYGPLWFVSPTTGKQHMNAPRSEPCPDQYTQGDTTQWLDDRWVLCSGYAFSQDTVEGPFIVARDTYGPGRHLVGAPPDSGIIWWGGIWRLSDNRFLALINTKKGAQLWDGSLDPVPHLTRPVARVPMALPDYEDDRVAASSANNHWLWWLSTDRKHICGASLRILEKQSQS